MSEHLKKILSFCKYKEPENTKFYLMLRRGMGYEVEKKNRNGYTYDHKEFGIYSRDSAFSAVKDMDGNGCLRFAIEKDFLDSIVAKFNSLQNQLKEAEQVIEKALFIQNSNYGNSIQTHIELIEWKDFALAHKSKYMNKSGEA